MNIALINIRQTRAYGISDDQEKEELRLQRRFESASAETRNGIEDVNAGCVLVEIEPSAFADFLNDECLSARGWSEQLAAARRG